MDDLASQMRQMGHKWSRTTVYSIEHGERRLQLSEAADLVHCLGLDPVEGLLALLSDPSEPDKARALSEKRLLEKIRNLELAWEEFKPIRRCKSWIADHATFQSRIVRSLRNLRSEHRGLGFPDKHPHRANGHRKGIRAF